MRIEVELLSNGSFSFPKDYRNYFMSFLKSVFTKAGVLESFYEEKRTKPFVFSVWLGDKFEIEGERIHSGDRIYLLFSTGEPSILTYFYNGVISIKERNENILLGRTKLQIKNITLQPLRRIKDKKILCKTKGISVLTNPEASARNFKNWYIIPTDDIELFNKVLKKRTNERYERIRGKKGNFGIELKPLTDDEFFILKSLQKERRNFEKPINETIVKHYGAYLRGFRGFFFLERDKEILQFVYDYGLGVRTGQGFGMIELLG